MNHHQVFSGMIGCIRNALGQIIAVTSNSAVDGDKMRGPYAVFTFTNGLSSAVETYAFNAVFNRSMLHNELVN